MSNQLSTIATPLITDLSDSVLVVQDGEDRVLKSPAARAELQEMHLRNDNISQPSDIETNDELVNSHLNQFADVRRIHNLIALKAKLLEDKPELREKYEITAAIRDIQGQKITAIGPLDVISYLVQVAEENQASGDSETALEHFALAARADEVFNGGRKANAIIQQMKEIAEKI